MPATFSQREVGRLRDLIRDKNKSPAARIKHSKTLWTNFPSANNRKIINVAFNGILKIADEDDRAGAAAVLAEMERFTPAAQPPCLIGVANPAARPVQRADQPELLPELECRCVLIVFAGCEGYDGPPCPFHGLR